MVERSWVPVLPVSAAKNGGRVPCEGRERSRVRDRRLGGRFRARRFVGEFAAVDIGAQHIEEGRGPRRGDHEVDGLTARRQGALHRDRLRVPDGVGGAAPVTG